jgi:hypothetical protein
LTVCMAQMTMYLILGISSAAITNLSAEGAENAFRCFCD